MTAYEWYSTLKSIHPTLADVLANVCNELEAQADDISGIRDHLRAWNEKGDTDGRVTESWVTPGGVVVTPITTRLLEETPQPAQDDGDSRMGQPVDWQPVPSAEPADRDHALTRKEPTGE